MYITMHVAGNELFYNRKYQEAAAHYTDALKKNPNEPAVRILVYSDYATSEGKFYELFYLLLFFFQEIICYYSVTALLYFIEHIG